MKQMTSLNLNITKIIPINEYGIVGVGSTNIDYILKKARNYGRGSIIKLEIGGYEVVEGNRTKRQLLLLPSPFIPDNNPVAAIRLIGDEKHRCENYEVVDEALDLEQLVLFKDVERRPGGGIVNLAQAFLSQTKEIPFGLITLRGEHENDELVPGTWPKNFNIAGRGDQANLIIPGETSRTIIRGRSLGDNHFDERLYLNPNFPFRTGTILINSLVRGSARTLAGRA
ncbi:MAG: hypothetical protein ABIC95_05200 [archaeon]